MDVGDGATTEDLLRQLKTLLEEGFKALIQATYERPSLF